MKAQKLKKGDEIRVIAPARSLKLIGKDCIEIANNRFNDLGLKVTFGKNVEVANEELTSPVSLRIEDLHDAFSDKNVKAIFTVIGGFNSNQILPYIDYDIIKSNPKILCGFSDITALLTAIYVKTGLITYEGPHYSSFGMKHGFDYSKEYMIKMLMEDEEIEVKSSEEWSDDLWFIDQEKREFIKNEGMFIINEGEASGKILGGNLSTIGLLKGTEYMPDLSDSILFIEDDNGAGESFYSVFERRMESIMQQRNFDKVRGIVIGRAQKSCNMNKDKWTKLIKSKDKLNNIPIIANADFGHSTPIFTFPIGGDAILVAKNKIELKIRG